MALCRKLPAPTHKPHPLPSCTWHWPSLLWLWSLAASATIRSLRAPTSLPALRTSCPRWVTQRPAASSSRDSAQAQAGSWHLCVAPFPSGPTCPSSLASISPRRSSTPAPPLFISHIPIALNNFHLQALPTSTLVSLPHSKRLLSEMGTSSRSMQISSWWVTWWR